METRLSLRQRMSSLYCNLLEKGWNASHMHKLSRTSENEYLSLSVRVVTEAITSRNLTQTIEPGDREGIANEDIPSN